MHGSGSRLSASRKVQLTHFLERVGRRKVGLAVDLDITPTSPVSQVKIPTLPGGALGPVQTRPCLVVIELRMVHVQLRCHGL